MSENNSFRPERSPVKGGFPSNNLEIKGNIPPELLEKLQQNSTKQNFEEVEEMVVPEITPPQKAPSLIKKKKENLANAFNPVSVSNTLQSILEDVKETSSTYEKITLPSLGKFYDGTNGPTDGVLHIRPMTGAEEQILATQRFVKKGVAIDMIFNKCIKESKQYSSEKFLDVDRTYLLIYLRGISYGPEYDVEITCPFTDNTFPYTINLDTDLSVERCPDDFGPENLYGVLPSSKLEFTYRLPDGQDTQKIMNHRERNLKFDVSNQADDTLLYRTALLINEIGNEKGVITDEKEILILLKNLKMEDLAYLRSKVTEEPFGVNSKLKIISPYTQQEFEQELPYGTSFFLPTARKEVTQA